MTDPVLYHFGFSTCSQKVRLALAEKGVGFTSREVNLLKAEQHDPEYVKLNPAHVVPTLVVGDRVLVESSLINEFIDDYYPGPALRPADALERYRAATLIHHVDTQLHGKVTGVLTHAILTRGMLSGQTAEQRQAYLAAIPDLAERKLRESLLTHGAGAPEVVGAVETLVRFFAMLEAQLATRPWFSHDSFGLADATVLPYVARFRDMGLGAFWAGGLRPAVENWLDRAMARPTYDVAVRQWAPEQIAETFRKLGEAARPQIEPIIDRFSRASTTAAA